MCAVLTPTHQRVDGQDATVNPSRRDEFQSSGSVDSLGAEQIMARIQREKAEQMESRVSSPTQLTDVPLLGPDNESRWSPEPSADSHQVRSAKCKVLVWLSSASGGVVEYERNSGTCSKSQPTPFWHPDDPHQLYQPHEPHGCLPFSRLSRPVAPERRSSGTCEVSRAFGEPACA